MPEKKVGEVVKFFSKPCVAAVKMTEGEIKVGDTVRFRGHTTDFTMVVLSMEVENRKVEHATAGDFVGIETEDRVRAGDEVFEVTPD